MYLYSLIILKNKVLALLTKTRRWSNLPYDLLNQAISKFLCFYV